MLLETVTGVKKGWAQCWKTGRLGLPLVTWHHTIHFDSLIAAYSWQPTLEPYVFLLGEKYGRVSECGLGKIEPDLEPRHPM